MSTITDLQSSSSGADSLTIINNNFDNLNTDKLEAGAITTHASAITGVHGLVITAGQTITVPASATVSGTNTGDNAANSSSTYIGTTAVALNRASAALTLAGITLTTPNIGTPSAGTLTNCTALPISGLTASTSTAIGVGSIELGHASDTTITRTGAGAIAVENVAIPTISSTSTLTNKRITQRVWSATTDATPDINTDLYDAATITALDAAITDVNMLEGSPTPTNFQRFIFRIKDNGTARAIAWGSDFEAKGVALPTTTVISKVLTVGFIYDTVTSKWGCVASAQEA
jgi:hypothetical protein